MWLWLPAWLPFVPITIGVLMLLKSWQMNATSSFGDGFELQMAAMNGGIAFLVAGASMAGMMMLVR